MASVPPPEDPAIRRRLERAFPQLVGAQWTITSDATPSYNCIAWAMGQADAWIWPIGGAWPPESPSDETVGAITTFFSSQGYRPDAGTAPGAIAVFAVGDEVRHVARLLPNGRWTSRLGSDVDISHPLRALEGRLYGTVVLMMAPET